MEIINQFEFNTPHYSNLTENKLYFPFQIKYGNNEFELKSCKVFKENINDSTDIIAEIDITITNTRYDKLFVAFSLITNRLKYVKVLYNNTIEVLINYNTGYYLEGFLYQSFCESILEPYRETIPEEREKEWLPMDLVFKKQQMEQQLIEMDNNLQTICKNIQLFCKSFAQYTNFLNNEIIKIKTLNDKENEQ